VTSTPSFAALNTNPVLSPVEPVAAVERVTVVRLADSVIVQLRCRPDNADPDPTIQNLGSSGDAKIKAIRLTCKTTACGHLSLEHRDEIVRHND
jgi:hypothetical protein